MDTLDIKQLIVIEDFINGNNIFMSGPAGTGKTHLIKILQSLSNELHKNCQVTALTGCAALLLDCNAKTLHSWSGVGITEQDNITYYINKIQKNKKTIYWKEIDVLIVDEISMLSKKLFNLLDLIAKRIRKNDKPFGGIQLVFSGDFYQLPPVSKDNGDDSLFCFESENWSLTFPNIHILTKIFRQKNKEFTKILNNIRVGKITKSTVELLNKRIIPYEKTDSIVPTILLPHRSSVDSINNKEHNLLPKSKTKIFNINIIQPSDEEKYKNEISNTEIKYAIESINKSNGPIEIKVGDQVICTYNISEHIVNGSRGIVTDILDYPMVKFFSGEEIIIKPIDIRNENVPGLFYKKVPLDYAWALTIHKCQGMTLDLCIMDIGSKIFAVGQTYVSLSRVKSLEGLYLINFDPYKIKISSKVKRFYEQYDSIILTKDEKSIEKKRIIEFINIKLEENKHIIIIKKEDLINNELLNKLKEYRLEKSKEINKPCYCILTNDSLNIISTTIPKDEDDLLSIKGIGKKKLESYGKDILSIIETIK
jgi:ATP-dependent DNA helicase PIF1